MSDERYRRLFRTGLAPLVEDVPEGPGWDELSDGGIVTATPAVRRMSGWLVGLAAAAVVVVLVGVAVFLAPTGPPSTTDPLQHPLMSDAVEIPADNIFTDDLKDVMAVEQSDTIFMIPSDGHQILVRIRPGSSPHLYATSCDVLTGVELPRGWEGTCLERTLNQQRVIGVFEYKDVAE